MVGTSDPGGCSRSPRPASRTVSRWTRQGACTPPRSPGCRCSTRPATSSARSASRAPSTSVSAAHAAMSSTSPRTPACGPRYWPAERKAMSLIRTRKTIDDSGAAAAIAAASTYAEDHGHRVVIAVVDPSGELIQLARTPGAQIASSRVAVDKARTAAIFVRPSREIEEQVSAGRLGALALHGASALTGGIPLTVDGEVVGAVGTSGETPDEDESVSLAGAAAAFTVREVPALTYEGARMAAEAAGDEAARRGVAPVISAVDAGGALMFLVRPDLAQVASVEVTTDKARTAAIYRRPSKDFEDQASGGRPSALHLARSVPLQGGIPIEVDGHVIGAVGVSGATSADEDNELAMVAAAALRSEAVAA